ncbi:MAG: M67 family metallopeptidase [Acidobacteria bacterium]|nr:M67 family metallopeptidase [Acidobacteriota bacterium]
MSSSLNEPVKIKRHVIAGIEKHGWECLPFECCGLLAGRGDIIDQLYRLINIADTPETRYFADPKGLFQATKLMRTRGEKFQGIYHSHPRSAAYPSPTDVQQAYYPEAVYLILSLVPKLELRAFSIREGKGEEIGYEIVDD